VTHAQALDLFFGHKTAYQQFVSRDGQDICDELTDTFEKAPPWRQHRHYWELIALAYNLQLLFDEERDAAVTNRALVTFFQEPEGPGEADAPPAEIDMDKLSKQARSYGKQLVKNAASMHRFPSIPLVNYAKTGLRRFRAGAEADAMHAVMLLLGRLLLADSTWAELQALLTLPAEGVDARRWADVSVKVRAHLHIRTIIPP
jgi:hypothetical protein